MYSYKDAENNYNEFMMNYLSTTNYYNPKFFNCRNPNHIDNKPSMKFNPKNNKVHCFSCGVTYGLVDLVIDENNPTNYFIDFDINRLGGNLPSDYYVEPKKEVEEKIEDGYITNNEAKNESLEYTVVSEEEFNRLRNE